MLRTAVILLMLTACTALSAGELFIRGIVRDSLTTEGLPFASVRSTDGKISALTDEKGIFEMSVPEGTVAVAAACQGYRSKIQKIRSGAIQLYDIELTPAAQQLAELEVRPGKYSKRGNPAVDFARRLRQAAPMADPRRRDDYSYSALERITMGISDFDTSSTGALLRRYPFLRLHIDTTMAKGSAVLTLLVKERATNNYYRRRASQRRTVVDGYRSEGIDDFVDGDNTYTVMSHLLRPVDVCDENIELLNTTFASPLSRIAPDWYRFYLTDSAAVIPGSDKPHISLAFYPRTRQSQGFRGHIYVAADDSAMNVSRIEMDIPSGTNLNFVESLHLVQNFHTDSTGSRLPVDEDLQLFLRVSPHLPGLHMSRHADYGNYSYAAVGDSVFEGLGAERFGDGAYARDSLWWQSARNGRQLDVRYRPGTIIEQLNCRPLFRYGRRVIRYLAEGYVGVGKGQPVELGPLNTLASYNSLEGLRLRAGGLTTAALNPHVFGSGYVAYGFRDHRWKYGVTAEYSFNAKRRHAADFPIHSVALTHSYDVDRLGTHYLYTNADNFVMSLSRLSDNRYTYRRFTRLKYTLELHNHFAVSAAVEQQWQQASRFVPFVDFAGLQRSHFSMVTGELSLRYSPAERFYQTATHRIPVDSRALVLELNHRWGPSSKHTPWGVCRTELTATQLFGLSVAGDLDVRLAAGHQWVKTVFTELFAPPANLSYTIRPGTFALLNPMEFLLSTYASWHIEYQMRGLIIDRLPFLRQTGWRTVLGWAGFYGSLADKFVPSAPNGRLLLFPDGASQAKMTKPYMELSAGVDNIFHCLRVDYVWRLNYLNVPYAIDRRGLRVAVNFTF